MVVPNDVGLTNWQGTLHLVLADHPIAPVNALKTFCNDSFTQGFAHFEGLPFSHYPVIVNANYCSVPVFVNKMKNQGCIKI